MEKLEAHESTEYSFAVSAPFTQRSFIDQLGAWIVESKLQVRLLLIIHLTVAQAIIELLTGSSFCCTSSLPWSSLTYNMRKNVLP